MTWDQKDVVSPHSDLAEGTGMLGHIATAGLNFAFGDIGTIIDPNATGKEKMLASAFLFGNPLKAGDKIHDVYRAAHKTKKSEKTASKLKTFKSDESIKHFEKHGNEIKDAMGKNQYNLKNYLHDANHVIQNGQHVPELNGYVKLIGGKGSAKYGFVGIDRNIENITTFHIKTVKELSKKAPSLGIK